MKWTNRSICYDIDQWIQNIIVYKLLIQNNRKLNLAELKTSGLSAWSSAV